MPDSSTNATAEQSLNDVLDWDAALRRVGGRADLLEQITKLFLTESDKQMREIHAAITDGDAAKLRCMAHSLKGSADCFSATATVQAAMRLEAMGRDARLTDAADAYAVLELAIERLKAALAARYQNDREAHDLSQCEKSVGGNAAFDH